MALNKQTKENIKIFIIGLLLSLSVVILTYLGHKVIAFVVLVLGFIYIFATLNVLLQWIIYGIPILILYIKKHEQIDELNKKTNGKILGNKTLKESIIENFHSPGFIYELMK